MRIEGLKDGTAVHLRQPTVEDVERSLHFFTSLSEEDRRYLRVDVTSREIVQRRIQQAECGAAYRLFALVDDVIVGDGGLEFSHDGWRKHSAEIRVIIAPQYRRRGLGALLIQELFREAEKHDVRKVVAKMAAQQSAARGVFERLGFHVDAVLPKYIEDMDGKMQDMVVMTCTLDETFRALKDFYKEANWPDG